MSREDFKVQAQIEAMVQKTLGDKDRRWLPELKTKVGHRHRESQHPEYRPIQKGPSFASIGRPQGQAALRKSASARCFSRAADKAAELARSRDIRDASRTRATAWARSPTTWSTIDSRNARGIRMGSRPVSPTGT